MSSPIDTIITAAVRCTICGSLGIGTCDCWVRCKCGWSFEKGHQCRNPECAYKSAAPVDSVEEGRL